MEWIFWLFLISSPAQANTCQSTTPNMEQNSVTCSQVQMQWETQKDWKHYQLNFYDGFSISLRAGVTETATWGQEFEFDLGYRALAVLNEDDKKRMEEVAEFLKITGDSESLKAIVFFQALPVNESLQPLAKRSDQVVSPYRRDYQELRAMAPANRDYTSICESVGKERLGFFWWEGSQQSRLVPVGFPTSNCYGRCGAACSSWRHIYTQECLDHDVCHRTTGENFGICLGQFIGAIAGFLWGNFCG